MLHSGKEHQSLPEACRPPRCKEVSIATPCREPEDEMESLMLQKCRRVAEGCEHVACRRGPALERRLLALQSPLSLCLEGRSSATSLPGTMPGTQHGLLPSRISS